MRLLRSAHEPEPPIDDLSPFGCRSAINFILRPVDEDLDGTWAQTGDVVRLQHSADTFLRDIDLVLSGNKLTGQMSDPTFVLSIVFTKN